MTENKRFRNALIEFDKVTQNLEREKKTFEFDVKEFMRNKGIPVKILFFGKNFGLDIDLNVNNWQDVPRKIPLDVLSDFCKEFGCDFEYNNCDGNRWIFSFNGMKIGY